MPLSDLAAALAAATGPDRALDERLAVEVFGHPPPQPRFSKLDGRYHDVAPKRPAYTASLDAITSAIKARWPGAIWSVDNDGACSACIDIMRPTFIRNEADGATPALALCLAAVRLAMAEEGK